MLFCACSLLLAFPKRCSESNHKVTNEIRQKAQPNQTFLGHAGRNGKRPDESGRSGERVAELELAASIRGAGHSSKDQVLNVARQEARCPYAPRQLPLLQHARRSQTVNRSQRARQTAGGLDAANDPRLAFCSRLRFGIFRLLP